VSSILIGNPVNAAPSAATFLYSPIEQGWKAAEKSPSDLSGHWVERVFQWGIRNHIIEGYSDGTYQPDRPVLEAEFLLMLYRAYGFKPIVPNRNMQWSDSPYRYALDWKQPVLGINDKDARTAPITRGKAAEILTSIQGVRYEGNDAIQYLFGHNQANGKTDFSIGGFAAGDLVTRAEALQWIRNLLLHGVLEIQQTPVANSDRGLLPALPPSPEDDLPDFMMVPISQDVFSLQDLSGTSTFPFGASESAIEAKWGSPTGENVFHMKEYGSLRVHYDESGSMDAWSIGEDGNQDIPPFQTSLGVAVNKSTMSDVLRIYGTAGYEIDNFATYFYETVEGILTPRFSRNEIIHPENAFVISFSFDTESKKVSSIYVDRYSRAYQSYPINLTDNGLKYILNRLIPRALQMYGIFNGTGAFNRDVSKTIPGEDGYALVIDENFKSVTDLKKAVEEVFTTDIAQTVFYSRYLTPSKGSRPLYKDYEGKLYEDTNNGGHGWATEFLIDTAKLKGQKDNVAEIELDITVLDEPDDPLTITIQYVNGKWLLASRLD
jgi:hypothetical protein